MSEFLRLAIPQCLWMRGASCINSRALFSYFGWLDGWIYCFAGQGSKDNPVFTEEMEPLCSLAKDIHVNVNLCVFCEKRKGKDYLIVPGWQGLKKARESWQRRKQVGENNEVINRLDEVFSSYSTRNIRWHKQCYGHFTEKTRIDQVATRISKQSQESPNKYGSCSSSKGRISRRSIEPVNWDQCIFC